MGLRTILDVHEHVQIVAPALARDVGVVRGGDEPNRLGRARIQVARRVRPLLDRVCVKSVLIVDHNVVRWFHMTLQPVVRLESRNSRDVVSINTEVYG